MNSSPKKFLSVLGIVLLVAAAGYGIYVFRERHSNKEAVVDPATSSKETISPEPAVPAFDKKKYSTTDPTSIWIVVNKKYPLNPKQYAPADLVAVGNAQQMRTEAATALGVMIAAAKAQGLSINPLSGYRSYSTQVSVYNNEVKSFGQAVADTESARPGYSEHQTGWGIDVGGGSCGIEDCFGNTAEGKWVAAHAHEYGFIIRYPAGQDAVTGYRAEPWHIRYVGTELSQEMHEQGITTLEQFFGISGGGY